MTSNRDDSRRTSDRHHPFPTRTWSLKTSVTVRVVDIGLGGALIASNRAFAVGERFALRLVLKERACVARGTVARVARHEGPGAADEEWLVGVAFTEWDHDGRALLHEFLTGSFG